MPNLNAAGGPIEGTVRRLAEPAQVDPELLEQLQRRGVMPGARATTASTRATCSSQMDGNDEGLELPVEVASHIFLVDDRPDSDARGRQLVAQVQPVEVTESLPSGNLGRPPARSPPTELPPNRLSRLVALGPGMCHEHRADEPAPVRGCRAQEEAFG